jgi:hypothetical protein
LCGHPAVLMRSLVLCAGTVGGFEPDSSKWQPSTGPFSTARVPGSPDLPDSGLHVARYRSSSTDGAGALWAYKRPSAGAALLDVLGSAAVRVVSVGARWGL